MFKVILCVFLEQGCRHEAHVDDETIDDAARSSTAAVAPSLSDTNANAANGGTSAAAVNLSLENEEGLASDDVFDNCPPRRYVRVPDSVRRLVGGLIHNQTQAGEGEWVSTSSDSASPVTIQYNQDSVFTDHNFHRLSYVHWTEFGERQHSRRWQPERW